MTLRTWVMLFPSGLESASSVELLYKVLWKNPIRTTQHEGCSSFARNLHATTYLHNQEGELKINTTATTMRLLRCCVVGCRNFPAATGKMAPNIDFGERPLYHRKHPISISSPTCHPGTITVMPRHAPHGSHGYEDVMAVHMSRLPLLLFRN